MVRLRLRGCGGSSSGKAVAEGVRSAVRSVVVSLRRGEADDTVSRRGDDANSGSLGRRMVCGGR